MLGKSPKTLSSRTKLAMREKYETIFNIFNHDAPNVHSLALMTMQPSENSSKGGGFERRLKEYMAFDVLKYTGLSIKELMSYTRERVEIILEECRQRQARDSKNLPSLPE